MMADCAKLGFLLVAAVTCLGSATPVQGMDRWEALAMIESGTNDEAVGSHGEISRYQIKPAVWRRYAATNSDWRKAHEALSVARKAMEDRVADFKRTYQRDPTDFEFYVLWNAPAQVAKPTKVVAQRAQRYCNLVLRQPS